MIPWELEVVLRGFVARKIGHMVVSVHLLLVWCVLRRIRLRVAYSAEGVVHLFCLLVYIAWITG